MVIYEAQWDVWVLRKVASKKKTVKELKVGGSKWLEDGRRCSRGAQLTRAWRPATAGLRENDAAILLFARTLEGPRPQHRA